MAIYWLVIFEGALRKWIFPQYGREIFFIRDPLVIFVYFYALSHRLQPRSSPFLIFGLMFAGIAVPLVFLQSSFFTGFNWLVAAYGWRNYFLYLPLAFFIPGYFTPRDVNLLMRRTLLLSIPIAALVYLQFRAPGSAPINQGFGTTDEELYVNSGVAGDVVRTFGTFTSSLGQTLFVACCVSMLLGAWLTPERRRPVRGMGLLAATASVLTCLALSGSRAAFVWAGIVFFTALSAAAVIGPQGMNIGAVVKPVVLVLVGVICAPLIFPSAVQALATRFEGADAAEGEGHGPGSGIFTRVVTDVFGFRLLLADTPLQGYQIGAGGNGSSKISQRALPLTPEQIRAAESDWGRHILELGTILGLLFILFRVCFFCWLLLQSITATRRSASPLPLLWFTLPGVLLLYGLVTGNGTANGYVWLLTGFCMAVNGFARRPQKLSVQSGGSAPVLPPLKLRSCWWADVQRAGFAGRGASSASQRGTNGSASNGRPATSSPAEAQSNRPSIFDN